MLKTPSFEPINRAYGAVFRPGRLTVGLVAPIEAYPDGRWCTVR